MLEGAKVISEALDAGRVVEAVFAAPGTHDPLLDRALAAGARVRTLAEGVIERVTSTVTPQPFVALAPYCDVPLDAIADAPGIVVCADVRDPANAGTILRSAEASGVGAVVFCAGSVDVFNPKAVRASAGTLFHVPVVRGGEVSEVLDQVGSWGFRRLGAVAEHGEPYDTADLSGRVALVMGNEAHGLPDLGEHQLDGFLTIPMAGRAESINVGMATAILCFEIARQRRLTSVPT